MPADEIPQPAPTIVDAAVAAEDANTSASVAAAIAVQDAGTDAAGNVVGSVASAAASTTRASATGGAAIAVTFSDVEAMTTSIQSLNRLVAPMITTTTALAVDPDLLESLVLSPFTGANAEAAVLRAAAHLTTQLVVTEGLALVTASVVTTYQLADNALQVSAAALGGGAAVGASIVDGAVSVGGAGISGAVDVAGTAVDGAAGVAGAAADLYMTTQTLPPLVAGLLGAAVGSFAVGAAAEATEALGAALDSAADTFVDDPLAAFVTRGGSLAVAAGQSFVNNFSLNDVSANGSSNLESVLGATGPYFDDILGLLIHDGQTLGLFNDGEAALGASGLSADQLEARAEQSANGSRSETGRAITTEDGTNRIIPTDVSSLLASSKQIDAIGKEDFASIRIFESRTEVGVDAQGNPVYDLAYTVQIPSTLVWNPYAGAVPNDVTADVLAVHGDQTALMNAVFDAMEEQGIPTGPDAPPVMTTGFSLGGITAAAMAADPRGYNIQQVVTAGSPISGMDIPADVHVTAFEADQDLVPVADGGQNPAVWRTVEGSGTLLTGESDSTIVNAGNVHDANRYAAMAAEHPEINHDSAINEYFSGEMTVTDYYATRE